MRIPRRETVSRRLSGWTDFGRLRMNTGAITIHATSTANCTSARETDISTPGRRQQGTASKHPHHLATIFGSQRGRGQRLGRTRGQLPDLGRELIGEFVASQAVGTHQQWRWIHAGYGDASIGNSPVAIDSYRNAGQWIVDRAAYAQFAVDTLHPGGTRWEDNSCQQLVLGKLHAIDAVVVIELREPHATRAANGNNLNLRVETKQGGRRIGRKSGPALLSAGRDVTQVAVFLNAKPARFAPCQRLVVPEAARVQADVAADRPHIPQHRGGDRVYLFVQHGIAPRDVVRAYQLRERGHGAYLQAAVRRKDGAQFMNIAEVDDILRREQLLLKRRHQIRTTGKDLN